MMKIWLFCCFKVLIIYSAFSQCLTGKGIQDDQVSCFDSISDYSGDVSMDDFVTGEVRRVLQVFEIKIVDCTFCNDRSAPNAYAMPMEGIHRIILGLHFINRLKWQFPINHKTALTAVIAHELAHVKQFSSNNSGELTGSKQELHADFLAGYYIGYMYAIELATEEDAWTFFELFYSLGDEHFYSPGHHGTPLQRKSATIAGWQLGQDRMTPFMEAYHKGIDHVNGF